MQKTVVTAAKSKPKSVSCLPYSNYKVIRKTQQICIARKKAKANYKFFLLERVAENLKERKYKSYMLKKNLKLRKVIQGNERLNKTRNN